MKVLIVDDDLSIIKVLTNFLENVAGLDVTSASNVDEAFEYFTSDFFPLVLSDIKMPGKSGLDLLKMIKEHPRGKTTKVIMITAFADLDSAVQALRMGANNYLFKPLDIDKCYDIIKKIEEENTEISADDDKSEEHNDNHSHGRHYNIHTGTFITIGKGINDIKVGIFSKIMNDITNLALKFHEDPTLPVLIEGESGTGKEIIASLIHHGMECNNNPFITINCSAIAPSLFESELFGYEGGTFTGANRKGMAGKLELSNKGTIFLDEIGEMPLDFQPKLLRVLQEKCFYRIGGSRKIHINTRFVAATNKPLKQLAEEGKFRWDLYYRLNTGEIFLPSLSKHKESIVPLAYMFLNEFSEHLNKKFRTISIQAVEILNKIEWKGNIRELKNAIHRIVLLYDDIEIRPHHLDFLSDNYNITGTTEIPVLNPDLFELPDGGLDLKALEDAVITKALEKFNGNKIKTANYLNITRHILRSKLKNL